MSRGIHTSPNHGIADTWLTPLEIIHALGVFDLDPCGYPGWPTATRLIVPPEDGLSEEWDGRVWLNPPYGRVAEQWLKRLSQYKRGIALVACRTETRWWRNTIWLAAEGILFLHGRLYFRRPDGTTDGNAGHSSALIAYGVDEAKILKESGIRGTFMSDWSITL
jgi:hypothetical protein